jgi:hypothetical protein
VACPTYAQLEAESWWGREIRTDELKWLGDELCRRTGAPAVSIGTKGNNCHLNGGHRSQEWITHSVWCTNHTYTVQSGLTAEQLRHLAALDRTPLTWGTPENRAQVAVETRRLYDAARTGKLTGITQVEGTLDGKTPFGYNVITGTTFTPDSSHLEHWHITFDRRFMHDMALMKKIADVVVGAAQEDQMRADYGDGTKGAPPSDNTKYLQRQLVFLRPEAATSDHPLTVDGAYGNNTAWWVSIILTGGEGRSVDGDWFAQLDQMVTDKKIADTDVGQLPDQLTLRVPSQDVIIHVPELTVTADVVTS